MTTAKLPGQGIPLINAAIPNQMSTPWYIYFKTFFNGSLVLPGTPGILTTNGSLLFSRTLTAGSTKISITNGTGATANPTVDVNQANLSIATSQLTGTLTGSIFGSQTANTVLAAPNGSAGNPTFRALVGADLPNPSASTLGGVESLASSASKWINQISTSGVPSATQPAFSDISGNIALSQFGTQTANKVLAGPTSGSAANPTFRGIIANDVATGSNAIPSAHYHATGSTTFTASTFTKVLYAGQDWDTGSYVSSSKATPLVAGIYHVISTVTIQTPVNGIQYFLSLYKNGGRFDDGCSVVGASSANQISCLYDGLISLNGSTDYIEMFQYNGNSSSISNASASPTQNMFSFIWVGPSA